MTRQTAPIPKKVLDDPISACILKMIFNIDWKGKVE